MTLRDYFEETGLKQLWLAQQLGISGSMLSLIVRGRRLPTPALAEKIRLVTKGKVLFDETPSQRIGVRSIPEVG